MQRCGILGRPTSVIVHFLHVDVEQGRKLRPWSKTSGCNRTRLTIETAARWDLNP